MDILVKVEDAHVDVFLNIGCCRFTMQHRTMLR